MTQGTPSNILRLGYGEHSNSLINSTMDQIFISINSCNTIRYASYRTASKMQVFHLALNMNYVNVGLIAGIFERHGLSMTENSIVLDVYEIEDVLSDIFFAAEKDYNVNLDVEKSSKLATHYIYKISKKNFDDSIPVFSMKVALVLLGCGRLEEKYGYLFHQLADHNACVSKASLNMLLVNVCKTTEMLGENFAYGNDMIQASIEKCFSESRGCMGVTEPEFASWLRQEPPLLMWITTLNRMKSAEQIVHNTKCSSCKKSPIQGPRYLCLKCNGYNQCQNCFLYGNITNRHKLKHPVREYCVKVQCKQVTKIFIKLMRNKFFLCPANDASNLNESVPAKLDQTTRYLDSMSVRSTMKSRLLNDPQKELQNIISHLEDENKQLQIKLRQLSDNRVESLQNHRAAIECQLQRLKILKKYLFAPALVPMNFIQSTPMIHQIASRMPIAFQLSPITHHQSNSQTKMDDLDIAENNYLQDDQPRSTDVFDPSNNAAVNPSTWIGRNKTTFINADSGFSQWLNPETYRCKKKHKSSEQPLSSGLKNIHGDLNDILDRLQNMVANDCLLEESLRDDKNHDLKKAATEMEDLLTGLIEGMEHEKGESSTII